MDHLHRTIGASFFVPLLALTLCCRDDGGGEPSAGTSGDAGTEPSSTSPEVGTTDEVDAGTGTASPGSDDGSTVGTGEPVDPRPDKPEGLVVYVTGNDEDADVVPTGPGLVLNGGNYDVDEGFAWWGDLVEGGDVVVIRISGSDGYNDYLYGFGNVDSVETMIVTAEHAEDPYVLWTLRHAEAIYVAGGDQAEYLYSWKGTGVEDALHDAWERGAVLGGISAGLAVAGEFVFAAYEGTVYSDEALLDPYNQYMELDRDFLAIPMLEGVVTDSHFGERDRMEGGR